MAEEQIKEGKKGRSYKEKKIEDQNQHPDPENFITIVHKSEIIVKQTSSMPTSDLLNAYQII